MIIYESASLKVRLEENSLHNPHYQFTFEGKGKILWPNREGELFSIASVYPFLKERGLCEQGISISWPATSSLRGFLFYDSKGGGRIVDGGIDGEGRHLLFRLTASCVATIVLSCFSGDLRWNYTHFKSFDQLLAPSLHPLVPAKRQFQFGFIGPDGKSSIGAEEGFLKVLSVAQKLLDSKLAQKGDIFHLFGYSEGHDRGYPDYTPSLSMGGEVRLKLAIEELHHLGFEVSAYLNGRLTCKDKIARFPHLKDSPLKDNRGKVIIETYYGNNFLIMNPSSHSWQEHLIEEARKLKLLGFDTVQLDQVAGRGAVVPVGEVWGKGYEIMIDQIHNLDLNVWIQGLCDYYGADRFELSFRDLNILADGTIRGGFPLGKSDPSLFYLLRGRRELIVPLSLGENWRDSNFKIIIDCLGQGGTLPLYGEEYLKEVNKLEFIP